MFGHDDKKDDDDNNDAATAPEITPDQPADTAVATATDQSADDQDAGAAADNPPADPAPGNEITAVGGVADDGDGAWQHPGEPIDDGPEQISDIIGPAGGSPAPAGKPAPSFNPPAPHLLSASDEHGDHEEDANVPHELIDIKQKALHELSPLMGQLDLEPEDKFRTLMMMIQASDDQKLLKEAYDVAHKIKDDKVRAQALLDIVNEINYFTQHPVD
ncbi:MAG TPA: hypothetical protein VN554_00680 [Verrucomicrobiae bacterium]|nr:hypothetical protein [Verrucomicrobiae bacterium]